MDVGSDAAASGRDASTAVDAAPIDGGSSLGTLDGNAPDATVPDPCLGSSEEDPGLASADCYCKDYKLRRPGVALEEGFDRALLRVDVSFGMAFTTNPASRYRFEDPQWLGQAAGRLFLAGGGVRTAVHASFMGRPRMRGAYLAIPFFVPKSAPDMTFDLSYAPDGQSLGYPSSGISFTMSPCAGDFRAQTFAQKQASTDPEYTYHEGGFSFGVADDPAKADRKVFGAAVLRKGRVFYLNVSEHEWLSGGEYRCPDEEPIDEAAFSEAQIDRLRNFGCGGLVRLQRRTPPASP